MDQQDRKFVIDSGEETTSVQQPGFATNVQLTRDVAAERRSMVFQIMWIAWAILGLIEILLGLRFLLKLIAANPDSGFASVIYGISGVIAAPFAGVVTTSVTGGAALEVTTLIAMVVYALFFLVAVTAFEVVAERPGTRTATRSVNEQMPDGSSRTTRTTNIT